MLYLGEGLSVGRRFSQNVGTKCWNEMLGTKYWDKLFGRNVGTKLWLPVAALDVEACIPVEPAQVPRDVVLQRRLLVLRLPAMVERLKW